MKAILRHELTTLFTTLYGYVFTAFLLLFAGIYTMTNNLSGLSAQFELTVYAMSLVLVIIVPILTMRTIADERRQNTDHLLYSLPISMAKVVLGKFLSLLVVLAIPLVVLCLYPLVLSLYGSVYLPAAYGTIVAFFFLGAALIAIGVFISSLTENPVVAAGICFAVMLLIYFLSSLVDYLPSGAYANYIVLAVVFLLAAVLVGFFTKNSFVGIVTGAVLIIGETVFYVVDSTRFAGLISTIASAISPFDRFYTFVYGTFDLSGIVYFISVAVLFLFLTVQSLEKRRWE